MLNRIRRALSSTRARNAPRGRHRRGLPPSCPSATPASARPVEQTTVTLGLLCESTGHRYVLRGEDVALVRPYILAWEKGARGHALTAESSGHSPASAWTPFLGVG